MDPAKNRGTSSGNRRFYPLADIMRTNRPPGSGLSRRSLIRTLTGATAAALLPKAGPASDRSVQLDSPARLLEALQEIHSGGSAMTPDVIRLILNSFQNSNPNEEEIRKLSPREREILNYLAQGYEPKEVSQALGTHYDTVKGQIKSVREKLNVRTREMAVKKAYPQKQFQSTVRRIEQGGVV